MDRRAPEEKVDAYHDAASPDSFGITGSDGATVITSVSDHSPALTKVDCSASESMSNPVMIANDCSTKIGTLNSKVPRTPRNTADWRECIAPHDTH